MARGRQEIDQQAKSGMKSNQGDLGVDRTKQPSNQKRKLQQDTRQIKFCERVGKRERDAFNAKKLKGKKE